MSFIERERDRLQSLLCQTPLDAPARGAIEAAQQALAWASDPDAFASPSATLHKYYKVGVEASVTQGTGVTLCSLS